MIRKTMVASAIGLAGFLAASPAHAIPCAQWVTVSSTPKSYSPCNKTTIGPWTSPVGGCLRWVSWYKTKQYIAGNGAPLQQRTYLVNEVQMQIKVSVGPVNYTKTQTVPGSYAESLQSQTTFAGPYLCG